MKDRIPVLITTDSTKRGVFFGYIKPEDKDNEKLEVYGMQMAVYWSSDVKGVLGLAVNGPSENCKISPVNKELYEIDGITLISTVSKKAEKAWKKAPWAN